jgi:hypothetical protein
MLDATGNNWETQSSAFTETLKAQITSSSSNYTTINAKFTDASTFWVRGKYKNAIVSNMTIGLVDPLPASSFFNNTSDYPNYFNAGLYFFQSGLTSIFGNTGRFLPSTPMRFNVSVEMEFDTYLGGTPPSGTTGCGVRVLESRLRINNVGTEIDGTYYSGLHLAGYISSNKYVRYRLTINHIFNTGDEIILQSYYDINTGTGTYTGARMTAMFILERQVL